MLIGAGRKMKLRSRRKEGKWLDKEERVDTVPVQRCQSQRERAITRALIGSGEDIEDVTWQKGETSDFICGGWSVKKSMWGQKAHNKTPTVNRAQASWERSIRVERQEVPSSPRSRSEPRVRWMLSYMFTMSSFPGKPLKSHRKHNTQTRDTKSDS